MQGLGATQKRSRSVSSSSASSVNSAYSDASSISFGPAPKYHRAAQSSSTPHAFICSLPPTCSVEEASSSYATESELLRHQSAFHKWICRTLIRDKFGDDVISNGILDKGKQKAWVECAKVFPEERLLTLVSVCVLTASRHIGADVLDSTRQRRTILLRENDSRRARRS